MSKNISDKIRVGVFFGGRSVEHEVSVISGLQAFYALDREKYEPIPVYIAKNGDLYTAGDIGEIEAYKDIKKLVASATRVNLINENGSFYLVRYPEKAFSKNIISELDVALPVVHGTNVEDGTLQGYLHFIGIPYAGCDVCSSALGMDKAASKFVLKENGIPVLDCVCINSKEYYSDSEKYLASIEEKITYPMIVKPVNLGSSVGVSKAKDRESLITSVEEAFSFASVVLIEKAVENLKEINCAVLGDRYEAIASVCEEPVNTDDILSYKDKYVSGGRKSGTKVSDGGTKSSSGMANLKRKIPAEISTDIEQKVKEYSVAAFQALGCSGVTRIDYLYNTVTGELYLNELNTIPGSLSFYLWEASGMTFTALLDELIKLAFKRHREEDGLNFSFDSNILSGIKLSKGKA